MTVPARLKDAQRGRCHLAAAGNLGTHVPHSSARRRRGQAGVKPAAIARTFRMFQSLVKRVLSAREK
jgi:hypothetical protein